MRTPANIDRGGRKILLAAVLGVLFINILQDVTGFKSYIKPLDGAYRARMDTVFSWHGWFEGTYQLKKDSFAKENFGLHNYYVRLINQLNFSLFGKSSGKYVIVGKNNYLFEPAYIDAYYGKDFIGRLKINDYIKKLKRVQDTLEKQHKLIFACFAPGKASFYPEFVPALYKSPPGISNYAYFVSRGKEKGVNFIDFNAYFLQQKEKSVYPLYPQYGIHWSNYGSLLAFDSITTYISCKTKHPLRGLTFGRVVLSDSLRPPDNDAIKSLNLLTDPPTFPMAYPEYTFTADTSPKKLNLLVIADSFWWYIYSSHAADSVFASSRFWYYNKEMYPESYSNRTYVSQVDYAARIREADVIMIMHSESTLSDFGCGFVDMAYETFCRPGMMKDRIRKMKKSIRDTPQWFKQVIAKARENKISVDSMLTLDAMYSLGLKK